MRMCWRGCARACTRAFAKPTPKQGDNARAFLRPGKTTPEGAPTLRICWHGCARARTHALASPTPKQGYNARAVLRRGGDARGYADVARVLAWLCACAHACAPEGTPTLRMCACVGMLVRVRACVRLRIQHQRREATRVPTNGESELGEDGNSGGNSLAIQGNSDPFSAIRVFAEAQNARTAAIHSPPSGLL